MIDFFQNCLAILKMAFINNFLWKPFIQKTKNPIKAQHELLLDILKRNSKTNYGKKYDFENITSYEEYQRIVPVNNYESLRSYIKKQEVYKEPYLNSEQPLMYAQTSGTTTEPKLIPILNRTVSQYKKSQHIVAYAKYIAIPDVYKGKVLAIVSPAVEGYMETGTPYGSMSGLVYQSMPTFIRQKYVVPKDIFEVQDYEKKYYLITKYALAEKNISMIATANPSTLIKLKTIIHEQSRRLLNEIKKSNARRAEELQQILFENGSLTFSDIWPNLKSITTWTGGSCATQISNLKKGLNETIRIVEMGYLSSEFRGSITIDVLNNIEMPALHEVFFEFVEKCDDGRESREFLTLDKIQEGKQYYIYATTQNGLYRYDINDLIEVTGKFNNTPTIRFVQKGKGVTNLTGEKLYEIQLIEVIRKVSEEYDVNFKFFMMLGCQENLQYTLYVESEFFDTSKIELYLYIINIEFKSKCKSGRLKPLKVVFLKDGTGEEYKRYSLKMGQREGQFKLIHLQYKQNCFFDFGLYARK